MLLLLLYSFWQTVTVNSLRSDLSKAKANCVAKVEKEVAKAVKPFKAAKEIAEAKAIKASTDYEKIRSAQRIKTETITHQVQKIVERPIYLNTCLDADGLHKINELILSGSSKAAS